MILLSFRFAASGLLDRYGNSLILALQSIFTEHTFYDFLFINIGVRRHYWSDINNQRQCFDWMVRTLKIQDNKFLYYFISSEVIVKYGAQGLLSHHNNSLYKASKAIYPGNQLVLPFVITLWFRIRLASSTSAVGTRVNKQTISGLS